MRRLFPLKPVSASNNNSNSNNLPNQKVDKDGPFFWEKGSDYLKENSLEAQMIRDHSSAIPKKTISGGGNSKRSSAHLINHHMGPAFESSSLHRRSHSSASSIFSSDKNDSSFSDVSKSSGSSADGFAPSSKCTPPENREAKVVWTNRSTSVPKGRPEVYCSTLANTPPSLSRSSSARITKVPEDFLEFSFDGREEEDEDTHNLVSGKAQMEIIADNETVLSSGRPPRSRLSGQDNIHIGSVKRLVRSQSFKGSCANTGEKSSSKMQGDLLSYPKSSSSSVGDKLSSRYQSARNVAERLVRSLPGKSKSKVIDAKSNFDSETVLIHCDGRIRREFLESFQPSGPELGSYHNLNTEELSPSQSQGVSPSSHCRSNEERQFPTFQVQNVEGLALHPPQKEVDRCRFQLWLEGYDKMQDNDEELEIRAKAAEDQVALLSEELESMNWYHCSRSESVSAKNSQQNAEFLWQKLRKASEEKRNLALMLSSEVQSRKRERSSATEALRLIKGEMESRTKILENEKNDLQQTLEKEIDRRSNEWASMLEKIRSEERRMRERVRDLAEQNVALQREVSSLNNQEIHVKSQVRESQKCMTDLRNKLTDAENEIMQLRESLSESIKKGKQAEDDRDSNKRSYKEKERENSELQKSVVRLQRLCKDQERTIGGLWGGLDNEINDRPHDKDDCITKLQKEQLRLVGVEQALRKELENCRWEAGTLRHENTSLLDRVRSREKGTSIGLIKLDQELWDRLDGLQAQAFPLLDENVHLSFKLLDYVKRNLSTFDACEISEWEHSNSMLETGQEWEHAMELDMMAQNLRRKVDSWKKSVWIQKEILKEKSHISCDESLKQDVENPEAYQQEQQHIENEEGFNQLQQELKAETLLVKILREKLCSKEADLEQLQEEIATLVRSQEVLRSNIESLQGRLSSSNQKEKELELLLGGKEDTIRCLQADLQECLKELTLLRVEIPKVSEERDGFKEDAEQLTWQNMKLIAEVEALKIRVEKLDEDVLVREGQLSILQESLNA
ncbi:uncharacterized protein LOC131072262 isoform X1 [Cryptomeria japonica]|uniref:uncharacterized protein LOC131072262 isoform X1 n=1 Tax=Cryptomeria japonica TaxID=3369 RepID=UPI0027DA9263|nr:uncharacterized protein LOC131072262 isoform X1 [Cryptomeria japonica]XP_057864372.2 uncharacterized protein LOC131072262 isoform X1 [Cryptomeria japonica]XP_057864375.2 uncharacterized protein LOC131072262 isoform X1 [Cryptomeria japonica]XP_059069154.1 uncharacterized protein LOC131072262 isoform X1 [Cryptomeria japonica]XP_059069155.1 uncharacterized protein LOC131072262 isoform X1 [Cryptomeria japonica]XP_059069156.1 uncharacterized protein LOC131072262 isoform X1 [Cryptomeria japonica]